MSPDGYHSTRDSSPWGEASEQPEQRQASQRSSVYHSDGTDRSASSSRTSSTAARPDRAAHPLHDAINATVRSTDSTNQVHPEFVAQITEQITNAVMDKLKAAGMTDTPGVPQQPAPLRSSHSRSPADSFAASIPRQFTPPSPSGRYESASHRSSSPEPTVSEASSYASNDMSKTARRRDGHTSPARGDDLKCRPKPARLPTAIHETTVLEKAWQPLFEDGRPTARLGSFLRGLALHLIDDYEPRYSLVVTPAKMSQFFKEVEQPEELYPFAEIFGGRCTNLSISRLYQTLKCQHHLTQRSDEDVPCIPGLTPHGFAYWMTTLIQADPEREFDRLAQAVLNMPISNADCPTERFPKELPRRLFPSDGDRGYQQRLYNAISADRSIPLRTSNPIPPPPPQHGPPPLNAAFERERNPYSSTPTATPSAASFSATSMPLDEDEVLPPGMPIERERQPYTAREGTGKIHDDNHPDQTRPRDQGPSTATRNIRSNSTTPAGSDTLANGTSTPLNYRSHRSSMTGVRPNYRHGTNTFLPSTTTAGVTNPYTKSEGANVGDIPRDQYASNLHSYSPDSRSMRDSSDESAREDQRRQGRRATLDDGFASVGGSNGASHRYSIPGPPRTGPPGAPGYEYLGGRDQREFYDDRRKSAYPGGGGVTGGTDGYGSYTQSGRY